MLPVFQWLSGGSESTGLCSATFCGKWGSAYHLFSCAGLLPVSASRGHWRGKPEAGRRGFILTGSLFLSRMRGYLALAVAPGCSLHLLSGLPEAAYWEAPPSSGDPSLNPWSQRQPGSSAISSTGINTFYTFGKFLIHLPNCFPDELLWFALSLVMCENASRRLTPMHWLFLINSSLSFTRKA